MIELLTLFYNKVKITKPLTSRPASSERYVVCEDFNEVS
jgi:23S rRNA U2552 (ribose-2'-O)-methylase RlmE/FtsJ